MRMAVVLALVAVGASPRHGTPDVITSDAVIQHLDLGSFANRSFRWGEDGNHTFADKGFVIVRKSYDAATLIQKSEGLTKSFEILNTDGHGLRLCFHEKWAVMPRSPSPMRFDYTYALMVWRAKGRLWKAEVAPGGFLGCINNPSIERDRVPNVSSSPSTMTSLINAIAPGKNSPRH